MARTDEEYDWLNDAFDEKKAAEAQHGMSAHSKRAIGIAAAAVIVVVIALIVVSVTGIADLFSF